MKWTLSIQLFLGYNVLRIVFCIITSRQMKVTKGLKKQNKKKKKKTEMVPKGMHNSWFQNHKSILPIANNCALGFRKKKIWEERFCPLMYGSRDKWVSTLVWLDRICYDLISKVGMLFQSWRSPLGIDFSSRSWGSCPMTLSPQPSHHLSLPSNLHGYRDQQGHLLCQP